MTTLGASLRFDHAFLSVEQEHRIHCMLELTAPRSRTTGSGRRCTWPS